MGRSFLRFLPLVFGVAAALPAQSYRELTFVRNRPSPYDNLLELEGGLIGGFPDSKDASIGLDSKLGPDGHIYYKSKKLGGRETSLDVYAGRDGLYLGAANHELAGQGNETRLELYGRLWPFYREGFYRGSNFIPTGRYEGKDWGGALSFGRLVDEGVRLEIGGFYHRYDFKRSGATAPTYSVPDDYNAYGAQGWFEQDTLKFSNRHGRPEAGYLATIGVQREWNNSNSTIGVPGGWQSTLPNGFWRGRGHIDWYFSGGDAGTVVLKIDGSLTDRQDRVTNFDAYHPPGHTYVDIDLGYRLNLGDTLFVTPGIKGEFIRTLDEFGVSSKSKTFFGFDLRAELDLSRAASVIADYSYLGNESRPPVSISEDTFGEHQFYLALRVRFGAK